MRIASFAIGLLAVLAPVTASSWSKEDHEIFRVRDELSGVLGPDVTFYDFIGVSSAASLDEINKAYRKKTRALHPDKVKQQLAAERAQSKKKGSSKKQKPGVHVAKAPTAAEVRAAVKKASDMQARLSIVANILRGPGRDRYDHFLSNGFPVWKGTGYYYSRYRPGFGTVLFGLFIFVGGGAHYIALYMGWKRQRDFMDRYIRFARQTAWGDNLGIGGAGFTVAPAPVVQEEEEPQPAQPQQPVAMNRKQRRMQERETQREERRSNTASGGRRGAAARRAGGASASGSGTNTPSATAAATTGGPTGPKKRVVAENGKILVVDSLGDVYLEQVDEDGNVEELLLDLDTLLPPTVRDTAVYRLPAWLYSLTIGRVLPAKTTTGDHDAPVVTTTAAAAAEEDDDDSSAGKATPSTDSNEEFEILGVSTESLGQGQARTTGSSNAKANKRKGKR